MRLDRREREVRNLGVVDRDWRLDLSRQSSKTGSEDQGDVGTLAEPLPHDGRRLFDARQCVKRRNGALGHELHVRRHPRKSAPERGLPAEGSP